MPVVAKQPEPIIFGPWGKGLVNCVDQRFVPRDGLWAADNIDIDKLGLVTTRKKWDLLDSAHYKSLVEHNGTTYGVRNNEVGIIDQDAFTSIASVSGPVDWTVLDGDLVYTDFSVNKIIRGASLVSLPTGYYENEEQDEYQFDILPAGSFIFAWQGRLLVARGRVLYWSDPLHYGVYSATRNRYNFGEYILWVAPLDSGVYVGLENSVVFLSGADPNQFKRSTVAGKSAPGVAAILDTKHSGKGVDVAIWLSEIGFAIGTPNGVVEYPQAERLSNIPLLPGKLCIEGDRVYAFATAEY